jgi:hypothetical protein
MVYNKSDHFKSLITLKIYYIKRLSLYKIAVKLGFGKPLGAGQICLLKLGFVITGLYNEIISFGTKNNLFNQVFVII